MGEKAYNFIKNNLMNFIVLLTSFAYIFYGQIQIQATGLTVWQVITSAGFGVIVGFIIKQALGENGINLGYSSKIWEENFKKYSETCNLAVNCLDKIDNFYLHEELRIKKEFRRKKLMQYRMNYAWFFTEQGEYIENEEKFNKLDKKQKKALKKCINIKVYPLNLMGEYDADEEKLTKKEPTDKDQRRKMFSKNTLAQLFSAIAGAYFVPMLNGWNWALLIISTIQVAIWIACGILQLYSNYNYVVIEKVAKLGKKKEGILRFIKGCENGLYDFSPYDEPKIAIVGEKTKKNEEFILKEQNNE